MTELNNILKESRITVTNKDERLKLTTEVVTVGSVIVETATDLTYYVEDVTKLDNDDGYKILPPDTDWVSCDNKLPDPFNIVKIKCDNGYMGKGFIHVDKSWWCVGINRNDKITDTKVVLWSPMNLTSYTEVDIYE